MVYNMRWFQPYKRRSRPMQTDPFTYEDIRRMKIPVNSRSMSCMDDKRFCIFQSGAGDYYKFIFGAVKYGHESTEENFSAFFIDPHITDNGARQNKIEFRKLRPKKRETGENANSGGTTSIEGSSPEKLGVNLVETLDGMAMQPFNAIKQSPTINKGLQLGRLIFESYRLIYQQALAMQKDEPGAGRIRVHGFMWIADFLGDINGMAKACDKVHLGTKVLICFIRHYMGLIPVEDPYTLEYEPEKQ